MIILTLLSIVLGICIYIGLIVALDIFLVEYFIDLDRGSHYILMAVIVLIEVAIPVLVLTIR